LLEATVELEKVEPSHPRYDQAQEMIKVANAILTELVTLHLEYGSTLEKAGRLTEAVQEYRRAFLLDTRRADAEERIQKVEEIIEPLVNYHLGLATQFQENGQAQRALDELRLVLVFDPNHNEAYERYRSLQETINWETARHYEVGLKEFQSRDYRSAREAMKAVLILQPDHEGAESYLEAIEKALQGEKRRADSKDEIRVNLRLEERRARLEEAIAAGDWSLALKEAKSLSEIDPQDEKTQKLLALSEVHYREKVDALFQQGIRSFQNEDLDSAISAWQQVLDLDANHDKAKEYLEKAGLMREKIRRIRGQRSGPTS
jgi:tetratricopeptide (TPR) repeat protein